MQQKKVLLSRNLFLYCGGTMDLLKTAAMEFENLLQVTYNFEIARKNNKKEFILNFRPDLNDPAKMVHRSTEARRKMGQQRTGRSKRGYWNKC